MAVKSPDDVQARHGTRRNGTPPIPGGPGAIERRLFTCILPGRARGGQVSALFFGFHAPCSHVHVHGHPTPLLGRGKQSRDHAARCQRRRQGAQCLFFLLNRILNTCVCLTHLLREVVWMRGGLADADEGPDEETTVLSPAVAPQD